LLAYKLLTRFTSFNIMFTICPLFLCRVTGFEVFKTGKVRIRDIEARSRNHFCFRKALNTKYYECIGIIALVMRHVNGIFSARYFAVINGLSGSIMFFYIIS